MAKYRHLYDFFSLFVFISVLKDECVFESILFRYHLLPSKKENAFESEFGTRAKVFI